MDCESDNIEIATGNIVLGSSSILDELNLTKTRAVFKMKATGIMH